MKYLSPISLFGAVVDSPPDRKSILLGRKKLLAELELAGGNYIEINGRFYDKNEIIRCFEELLTDNTLDYHTAVSGDKALLRLLEKAELYSGELFLRRPLYQDAGFTRWISPYFSESFNELVMRSYQRSDYLTMASLMNNPLLMTAVDEEKVWAGIARIMTDEIDLLERYSNSYKRQVAKWINTKEVPLATISGIMDYNHAQMISLLPQGRFATLRNKYAFAMMQAAIMTFNRNKQFRGQAQNWFTNAEKVAFSREQKQQILTKLTESRTATKTPTSKFRAWIFIVVALTVIRFAFSNTHTNTSFENTPIYVRDTTLADSSLRKPADSLNHVHHLTAPTSPLTPSR
jgi:hypothetical protein